MKPYFVTSARLDPLVGVVHGFFGRTGGVSAGLFDSLNCSPFSEDDAGAIRINRERVVESIGGSVLFSNRQVHGREVRVVGPDDDPLAVVEADGLVTSSPGVCIGALGADCAPVVFADSHAGVIGVAHGGWQGALRGITDAVIERMLQLGARVENIIAAVGPAIQLDSYEVGEKFRDKLLEQSPVVADGCFERHRLSGNVHFDLPGYITLRLETAGISVVDQLADDTYGEEARYFSYRRSCHRGEREYGRQIGVICLV